MVLNFVEYTQDTLTEASDGPPHASELDRCDDADELRAERRALAVKASSAALMALLDPSRDRSGREAAVEEMLNDYVAFDEGTACSIDDDWCDAPERGYESPTLRCQLGGVPSSSAGFASLLLVGVALLRRRKGLAGCVLALSLFTFGKPAHAADDSGPIDGPMAAFSGESDAAVVGKVDKAGQFFGRAAIGASYDNSALSGGVGLRYQLSTGWMTGIDAEWNPYIAKTPSEIRSGSANAYVSLIRRWQLRYEPVNIRSGISLGASMLMFDLVGADKYSMGPYFGLSFLGVEWKLARGFYLTIDPTYIAMPVPSIVGVPFMYKQYRFLVGVEFGG